MVKYIKDIFTNLTKWLSPGMEVKRWFFLSCLGVLVFCFGFFLIINIHPAVTIELSIVDFLSSLYHTKIPSAYLDVFFCITGIFITIFAQKQLFLSIYSVIVPYENKKLVEVIYEKRKLDMGVKIVAIGGGTGLSTLLRGLKKYTNNITAVVTVSDDGGSSGRLRDDFGMLPPGDIRNCLVALAGNESTLSSLFQYRFESGNGLQGHSFGNLFLAALNNIAGDDFQKAITISGDILNIKGKVYPATLEKTVLCAEMENGEIIEGESEIPKHKGKINKIFLKPQKCKPLNEVIKAIKEADIVILGPGSLYTSILPNLQVENITEEIKQSKALKFYICNIMTQLGETSNFTASDHLKALYKNSTDKLVDTIIINNSKPESLNKKYQEEGSVIVKPDFKKLKSMGVEVIDAPLINKDSEKIRHNSELLADIIIKNAMSKTNEKNIIKRILNKKI